MKKPKWLYRLESINPENGLWYNSNGNYVWDIGKINNCETKHLPMGYDERYRQQNKKWYSSCSNISDLSHWYSLKNALELIDNGFVFSKYLAVDYVEYEHETVFLKNTCIKRKIVDIRSIWDRNEVFCNEQ